MLKDKEIIEKAISQHYPETIKLSDYLYKNPEISHKEFESSKKIVEILSKGGYKVEYPFCGYDTAFQAVYKNGEGPSIAFLVEYDALPEIGHGCGHNLHGSLSVLAALAMVDLEDEFEGEVYVIGTPGEEQDGAKVGMAESGVFDEMSLAIMMHSYSGGASIPNMDLLSLRGYVVEFYGQEAHAVNAPWEGKSSLAAARKFLDLIDARRECFIPNTYVNAVIKNGGEAANIIPGYSKLELEFRTDSMSKLKKIDDMVNKCMNGAALALDCKVTKKPLLSDFADMIRVESLETEICRLFKSFANNVKEVLPPQGSSDMGNVSYCCPSIQPLISITDESYALHTKEMANATTSPEGHKSIELGAKIIVSLALKVLNNEDYRKQIYNEFIKKRDLKQQN